MKKAKIVSSEHIANVTGRRGVNILNDYDEADEEELRWLLQLRKSKYYIDTGSFRHHNHCGSTHPSMAASKENKLPPSFSGFKSQKFLHESSYDGVSGTDSLSSLAALLISNGGILRSCKRRALILNRGWIEKHLLLLIIVNQIIFNRLVTI